MRLFSCFEIFFDYFSYYGTFLIREIHCFGIAHASHVPTDFQNFLFDVVCILLDFGSIFMDLRNRES